MKMKKPFTKVLLKKLEKRIRNKKDKEWSIEIKSRFNSKCAVCGETKLLNAHHIIPRSNKIFRHDVMNGIALCPKHHMFSRGMSPHNNPFVFHIWFETYHPENFDYLKRKLRENELFCN